MDQLSQPIGFLMRPTFTVDLEDSLELSARKLRENGFGVLPVTDNGTLAGAVSEAALAGALAVGKELTDPVKDITQGVLTALPSTTGAEALRLFDNNRSAAIVVIDGGGRVLGIVAPSDLYPKKVVPPRPPMVGGMATPFGVYLTTGTVRAGVGHLALVATGMCLFGLYLLADWLTYGVLTLAYGSLTPGWMNAIHSVLPVVLFLLGMRALPLSGIHAAEHKVVHAIERGEELVPSTVRRMPRVHPRCGTNLAVGATLFLSIGNANLFEVTGLGPLIAAIVTLILWRPLGNAMQFYVTTRRPSEKHIAMGIRSGQELLQKYATSGSASAGIGQRLLNSGMFHVMAGTAIAIGITWLVGQLVNLPFLQVV